MSAFAQTIPDDAELLEAATLAAKRGMYLISNGRRSAISPVIPAGWEKVAIRVKTSTTTANAA